MEFFAGQGEEKRAKGQVVFVDGALEASGLVEHSVTWVDNRFMELQGTPFYITPIPKQGQDGPQLSLIWASVWDGVVWRGKPMAGGCPYQGLVYISYNLLVRCKAWYDVFMGYTPVHDPPEIVLDWEAAIMSR